MARKTVLVCDSCFTVVDEAKSATLRLTYNDARKSSLGADLCEECAGKLPGHQVPRRGRRPKAALAV